MLKEQTITKQTITVELINDKNSEYKTSMTNPLKCNANFDKISQMVNTILDDELPVLKNNSLLHDLVSYTLIQKMNTVQNVGNVLSYIKDKNVKKVRDVYFRNGEIRIKCSI